MNGSGARSHSPLRVRSLRGMITPGRAGSNDERVATKTRAAEDEEETAVEGTNGVEGTGLGEATTVPRRRKQRSTPQSSSFFSD